MPSRIQTLATRLATDGRIDPNDVKALTDHAKADNLISREDKRVLQNLLRNHSDKFDPTAKAQLQAFLSGSSPNTPTPTPPTPPAPPATPRDLQDPTVLTKHDGQVTWKDVDGGKLFVDGVSYDDVVQGQIANCYMVSAFSAVAHSNPDAIKNAIKDNGDGTFTVRFFERSYGSSSPREVKITVDNDQAIGASGTASYGKSRDRTELWVGVLEKAFAQWKGGYEAIGNGGISGDVMEALTGRPDRYYPLSPSNADSVFRAIQDGAARRSAMTAGTHGKDSGVDYSGTGVYAWHAYTVLGASEENGVKYVQLRNPWGRVEHGSDGKDDGIFKMKLEDFARLYSNVTID